MFNFFNLVETKFSKASSFGGTNPSNQNLPLDNNIYMQATPRTNTINYFYFNLRVKNTSSTTNIIHFYKNKINSLKYLLKISSNLFFQFFKDTLYNVNILAGCAIKSFLKQSPKGYKTRGLACPIGVRLLSFKTFKYGRKIQ